MRIRSGLFALLLLFPSIAFSDALFVRACGSGVAPRVNEFRWLLGNPVNAALAGQQPAGRREINWDGVPDTVTNTNTFPPGFFNTNSTRGLVMTSGGTGLRVSSNNFSDVNASYGGQFGVFSPVKSFAVVGGNSVDVTFQLAGTTTPAYVKGFGVVFSDVDTDGSATIQYFVGPDLYATVAAPARCDAGGLSFAGIVWNGSERITSVRITSGTGSLSGTTNDITNGGSADLVVMDDFIYGEPSALGQVLHASLSGSEEVPAAGDPDGTGFATVTADTATNTLRYSIVVQNIDAPTSAHIHTGSAGVAGPVLISLSPAFTNGIASGTVQVPAATLQDVLNNAQAFYVNVHNGAFPGGAVRGQLSYNDINATRLVFPVVGRVAGAGGTEYRADVRLVNMSGLANEVLLEYYAAGTTANSGPTASTTITLGAGEQEILDNIAKNLFNVDNGTGALRVIFSRPLIGTARIYNDQRATGAGTFGQFILGADEGEAYSRGVLPMLSNQPASSGAGYRTNIGWFNHQTTLANVTFKAHDNNGNVLATSAPQAIPSFSHAQAPLAALFPNLAAMDNLYVTFQSDNDSLFVYASVADNKNGDAIYIPAQPR